MVHRWRLEDPYLAPSDPQRSYTFPLNPNDMTSLYGPRNITTAATTALGGQALFFEGQQAPLDWSFSGDILDAQHYERLRSWVYDHGRRLNLYDHYDRKITLILVGLNVVPKRSVNRYWRHTYEISAKVISVGPPNLAFGGVEYETPIPAPEPIDPNLAHVVPLDSRAAGRATVSAALTSTASGVVTLAASDHISTAPDINPSNALMGTAPWSTAGVTYRSPMAQTLISQAYVVWHKLYIPANATCALTQKVSGVASGDTYLYVFKGPADVTESTPSSGYTYITKDDDAGGDAKASLSFTADNTGSWYYLAHSTYSDTGKVADQAIQFTITVPVDPGQAPAGPARIVGDPSYAGYGGRLYDLATFTAANSTWTPVTGSYGDGLQSTVTGQPATLLADSGQTGKFAVQAKLEIPDGTFASLIFGANATDTYPSFEIRVIPFQDQVGLFAGSGSGGGAFAVHSLPLDTSVTLSAYYNNVSPTQLTFIINGTHYDYPNMGLSNVGPLVGVEAFGDGVVVHDFVAYNSADFAYGVATPPAPSS